MSRSPGRESTLSSWLHMLLKKRSYAYKFLSSSLGIFQELQSRIVVAENLPGDPSYQNIKKIFSAVGRYGYCNMDELSSFFLPRIIKKQQDGYDSTEAKFSLMLFSNEYSEIMEQIDRDVKCTTLTCISSVQMPIAVSSTKLAWREGGLGGAPSFVNPLMQTEFHVIQTKILTQRHHWRR